MSNDKAKQVIDTITRAMAQLLDLQLDDDSLGGLPYVQLSEAREALRAKYQGRRHHV